MTVIPSGWTPEQARRRLEAATPGPWEYAPKASGPWGAEGNVVVGPHPDPAMSEAGVSRAWIASTGMMSVPRTQADAAFIAHAPADIAALLALLGDAGEVFWALNDWLADSGHGETMPAPLRRMCGALLSRLPAPEDDA